MTTVVISSDHAGLALRGDLVDHLRRRGYTVDDRGPATPVVTDFPDIAADVAHVVASAGSEARGILICGSGVGVSIAANKVNGIRAALAHDTYSAHQAVEHDRANVLCLGARVIGIALARELCDTFLAAQFMWEEDFVRRVRKIDALERQG
ncbi:RpiB/LacA/LacB family sugar-phosphate isomerase [Ruania alba]|uniref:Ribose 5-phosphate isomerase B n=1 Tax=Ruania alba TaxID=648782 RepID=A0A1H5M7H8_9MICO|nr:RpiB/LacA/LacB family sugar-phosphate isomerase [Ruania alba]SEE85449.1 ribose 5-phosphate isomerase B [Ruania alba]